MGEYLYYLAGHFKKNEKGLSYESTKSMAEVYVSFEEDIISVNRSAMQKWSEVAHKEPIDSSDFIAM